MGWKMGDWEKAIKEALGRWEEYGRDRGIEGSDKCRRSLRQPPSIEGQISLFRVWHLYGTFPLLEMHWGFKARAAAQDFSGEAARQVWGQSVKIWRKQKESMMFYQGGYLLVRRLNPSDFFDQEGFQERFDSDPSSGWVAGTRQWTGWRARRKVATLTCEMQKSTIWLIVCSNRSGLPGCLSLRC